MIFVGRYIKYCYRVRESFKAFSIDLLCDWHWSLATKIAIFIPTIEI